MSPDPTLVRDSSPHAAAPDVHVWLASLDQPTGTVARLSEVLSEDERERAGRFHSARVAERWAVGRALLRTIVGRAIGVEPHDVRFAYGPRGKPELADPFDRHGLRFNASGSDGLALYGIARDRRIGVDIERRRPLPDLDALAKWACSPKERQALRNLPAAERHHAFFDCWTRKEAYVKALGEGLAHPLDRFTVSLLPGAPPRLEEVQGDPAEAGRWTLLAVTAEPGFAAAVAVEGPSARLVARRWTENP